MPLKTDAAARKDKRNATGTELQHRHFAVIAAILARLQNQEPCNTLRDHRLICEHFADELAGTNARFDRERFLKACGV